MKKGIVYMVPCGDCEHMYIGKTGRNLKEGLKEHQYAVKKEKLKKWYCRTCLPTLTELEYRKGTLHRTTLLKEKGSRNNSQQPTR